MRIRMALGHALALAGLFVASACGDTAGGGSTGAAAGASGSTTSGSGSGGQAGTMSTTGGGGSGAGASGAAGTAGNGSGAGAGTAGDGSGGDAAGAAAGGASGAPSGLPIDDIHSPCEGGCPEGLTPVDYCGLAGCDLCSCEIPCEEDPEACPDGTLCATISDGPGTVCVRMTCSGSSDCGTAICCGFCGSASCSGQCSRGPGCPDGQMPL